MYMLNRLFGSRSRVKLLKLFFSNPEKVFFVREISRLTSERINSVRRELDNLMKCGLVKETKEANIDDKGAKGATQRKYYALDNTSAIFSELKSLILKSKMAREKKLFDSLLKKGRVKKLYLYGIFVDDDKAPIDVFIVGSIANRTISAFMAELQKTIGQRVRYTVMKNTEFNLRNDISDRFLVDLAGRKKIVIIDDGK